MPTDTAPAQEAPAVESDIVADMPMIAAAVATEGASDEQAPLTHIHTQVETSNVTVAGLSAAANVTMVIGAMQSKRHDLAVVDELAGAGELMGKGAPKDLQDWGGEMPLMLASKDGHSGLSTMRVQHAGDGQREQARTHTHARALGCGAEHAGTEQRGTSMSNQDHINRQTHAQAHMGDRQRVRGLSRQDDTIAAAAVTARTPGLLRSRWVSWTALVCFHE